MLIIKTQHTNWVILLLLLHVHTFCSATAPHSDSQVLVVPFHYTLQFSVNGEFSYLLMCELGASNCWRKINEQTNEKREKMLKYFEDIKPGSHADLGLPGLDSVCLLSRLSD